METMTLKNLRSSGPVLVRSELPDPKVGANSSNWSSSSALVAARSPKKKTCMCSPTTHPGSFRCSLHKRVNNRSLPAGVGIGGSSSYARRSAIANSLMRIGTAERDLVKRALAALIRPSSHQQRRRTAEFQPRPTRLSVMTNARE